MKNEIINKLISSGVQLKIIDGNLKINAPKGILTKELLDEIKENKEYLISLLSSKKSIAKTHLKESYALTPTQYFMWFTHEHLGGNLAYNISGALKISGNINYIILEKSFQYIIDRHESLRTVFKKNKNNEVRQFILGQNESIFSLKIVEFQNFSKAELHEQINNVCNRPFDLENEILLRTILFKTSENEHILLFVLHHIISDGWSLQLLTREVMIVYNSLISNYEVELPKLSIQFKDYSEWLNKNLDTIEYHNKLDYWKKIFETKSPILNLIHGKRPAIKTYNGSTLSYEFPKFFLVELNEFAKANQITLFMLLIGGLNGLFSRYSGQTDITLGTTVAGREYSELENQIGLYSNALAVRTQFEREDSFLTLIQKQKETLIKAYGNKEYPFTALVSELEIPKDLSRSPLFDIMVLLQNHQELGINDQNLMSGVTVSEYSDLERVVSQLDISFVFVEKEDRLFVNVEYNTDIYEENFIIHLLQHFEVFINNGLKKPNLAINSIEIVTSEEKTKLLNEFNSIIKLREPNLSIVSLFSSIAKMYPDHIALVCETERISYKLLEELTNKFANYLEKCLKVRKGDVVGVELERNSWAVITILSILKTGGIYVPIEINYPEERKRYIKEDSGCDFIINSQILDEYKKNNGLYSSEYISNVEPERLAYIIYTSGSTGNPKGVQIKHDSLLDYCLTFKEYFGLTSDDSIVQQASISFDTSIEEIFPILISGGKLVFQEENNDFESLFNLCERHEITILSTNPYALQYLNQVYDKFNLKIKTLISGGDVLNFEYINRLWDKVSIFNTYGPTESTVCVAYHHVSDNDMIMPIGRPITNRQVFVLSPDSDQLQPIGILGELCISGKGLALGYLNQTELTKDKFVQNPFYTDQLMYRTGDLGYWTPNGNLCFAGRKDNQVKIRGNRIELGEIEYALKQDKAITNSIVLVKEINDEKNLVAYLVGNNINIEVLKKSLRLILPEYMIPSFFVEVDAIPLNSNGKIDKQILLSLENLGVNKDEYVAPRTEMEIRLVSLWEKVLGLTDIGITSNFFELGGHSLKVIKLINELGEIGYKLNVKDVFECPTISGLIEKLQELDTEQFSRVPEQKYYPVTSSQLRLWTLSQFEGASVAYNISNVLELNGPLNISIFQESVNVLVSRHESLRTVFKVNDFGELSQYILPINKTNCEVKVNHIKSEKEILTIINNHVNYHFNLSEGPLFKIEIISCSENNHLLLFNLHHIVGDGWSMEVLSREIVTQYNNLKVNSLLKLPELRIQYKDYVNWYNLTNKKKINESAKYWREQFKDEIPVLELTTMMKRPKIKTYNGDTISFNFSSDFTNKLKNFSQQNDASLFMTIMAGLNGLFYRYSGQNDIILGTPVAGRDHIYLEDQIGLFLNTLAIRTKFNSSDTFLELLEKQREVLIEAYDNQSYPFDVLVEELSLKQDLSRSALFDVMVVLHNQQDVFTKEITLSDVKIKPFDKIQRKASQFDLSFSFVDKESLSLTLTFNTDIYTKAFVEKLINYFERFISEGIDKPKNSIAAINYISIEEKERLLSVYNFDVADVQINKTIIELIESQTQKTPDAIAIVFEDKVFTYKEIQLKSNQLAKYLRGRYLVDVGDVVGVKLERDEWLIIAILGVLKAGGTYVPIDLNYPEERISYIEQDSNCKVLINKELLDEFKQEEEESNIDLSGLRISPKTLAYIIYTSGSTGKPKGVMISHSNAVALLEWSMREFAFSDFDIVYAATSHCFDLSVFEMFYPLSIGKKIRIIPNSLLIDKYIVNDQKILINTVPSVIDNLLERKISLQNVSVINMAGEPVPINLSNTLIKYPIEIRNLYGPTEDTTYSSCYKIEKTHEYSLPIGKPLSNTKFYILSEELTLQGEGLIGEICISGAGLSMGYLKQPELTNQKFVTNPFNPEIMMYRTGDLGYWMPDGNLGFIGRKDEQIKLRGYRIELGEIENAILDNTLISNAVVLIKDFAGEKCLVAYFVGENIDINVLKDSLKLSLPQYMIPDFYVMLDEIPLTPNKKINKDKLLSFEVLKADVSNYIPPISDVEIQLSLMWQEILGLDKVSMVDNFFELGGNSLKAMKLLFLIENKFKIQLNIQQVFSNPTLKLLARTIENYLWTSQNKTNLKKIVI